jgi:hypothetical protein
MSLGLDEEKAEELGAGREADARYGKLRVIWLAVLAGLALIFVLTRVAQPAAAGPEALFWILLALGAGELGASFVLKQKMLRQAVEQRKPGLVSTAYVLAFALCESVGLFGLVAHFVTGSKYYYFLFALGGFGLVMHKPQRDDALAAAAGPGRAWEARRRG